MLANLGAMPAFSMIVMPAALASVLLIPFGLEHLGLAAMDWGLGYVLAIAEKISEWTGNAGLVPAVPLTSLLLVALGLIWLCLWRQSWRLLGLPMMAIGIGVGATAERPLILIEEDGGGLVARGADGAFRFVGSGARFELDTWLRADADPRQANAANLREGVSCDPRGCTAGLGATGLRVALSESRDGLVEDCLLAAVVVTVLPAPRGCQALTIDGAALQQGGAHAVYLTISDDGAPSFRTVAARSGGRPWMPSGLPMD